MDPFRDIVKNYASFYRDSELSRIEKENYNRWLTINRPHDKLNKQQQITSESLHRKLNFH